MLTDRLQKNTFGELREMGLRRVIVHCAHYRCSHSAVPDDVRLSDIESLFTCTACGKRGADVWPGFLDGEEAVFATFSRRNTGYDRISL